MRTIKIMVALGLSLGFLGCPRKDQPIDDDQDIVIEDNTENVQEEETNEEDEKHMDDPGDILQDLTF